MRPLLYLIGPSGSGKTTTLSAALGPLHRAELAKPLAHIRYPSGAVQLGATRAPFGGTDALPMNANPKAIQFLRETDAPALIAEGDRLANAPFFQAAIDAGWDLTIYLLDLPEEEAARRRNERRHAMSATFVKGRRTKVENIARAWPDKTTRIDATQPIGTLADIIRAHPAVQIARRA